MSNARSDDTSYVIDIDGHPLVTPADPECDWMQQRTLNEYTASERRLCAAVLKQALYDLSESSKTIRDDALEWFYSPPDDEYCFSFYRVCLELGLSADKIRAQLNPEARIKVGEYREMGADRTSTEFEACYTAVDTVEWRYRHRALRVKHKEAPPEGAEPPPRGIIFILYVSRVSFWVFFDRNSCPHIFEGFNLFFRKSFGSD